jgi:hypothetical protein
MEEELKKIREEIATVQRQIELLPEEKRPAYQARLEELRRTEADLLDRQQREDLKKIAAEIEKMKWTLGGDIDKLRGALGALAAEMREKVLPEDVARVKAMVGTLQMFHEGLLLPWTKEITEEITTRALWQGRIERGETELVHRVVGAYAIYESYHHLPTCQTWVKTIPRRD